MVGRNDDREASTGAIVTGDFRAIEPRLKELLAGLSTADEHYANAARRAEAYATTLRNDAEFGVSGTRIGGSIGKGTAIAPLSDVDLYVYLDARHWQTRGKTLQPGTVIGRLYSRIEKRLTFELTQGHTTIRRQAHSVGIRFRRAGSVGIDVVPALVDPADVTVALIPRRRTTQYIQTSVERQLQLFDAIDSPFHYLRRGIRLLKIWNRSFGQLPSYAVEILGIHAVARGCPRTESGVFLSALDFIGETNMRSPVAVEHFYTYRLPSRRACVVMDPAMPANNVCEAWGAAEGDKLGDQARYSLCLLYTSDAADE